MVEAYWRIGERIVRQEQHGETRAGYGEQMLLKLGQSLSLEHGRGFSVTNLKYMRQFYLTYQNRQTLSDELSWSHYQVIMRLPEELREFYQRLAVSNRWSVRQLQGEIGRQLHQRVLMPGKPGDLLATLPAARPKALTYEEAFRDPYILDFLGLEGSYSEKDLETALVRNIEKFLLELGTGFMFVARQQRIVIDDEDHYVDLVLYHRYMRCIVVVELKLGRLQAADVGQMKLYLEWFKRYDKAEGEADPIGLILCGSKGEQIIELLLSNPAERIQVSRYLTLDSQEAIRQHLERMAGAYEELREQEGAGEEPINVE
jgi:predicted nuclease of restriction endonuclease-like (RecB) superfamily